MMRHLVLTRKKSQIIDIAGGAIQIQIVDIDGNQVRIGFLAPENVTIDRREVTRAKACNTSG